MRAVICTKYGSPDVLKVKEIEKPTVGKSELCIKIHATTVTASDCIVRGFKVTAKYRILMRLVVGFRGPKKAVLGMVFAGEVESVGENVTAFKKGERVFGFDRHGFGTYAEYKCISEKGLLLKTPSTVSDEQAASIPYGGLIAYHFLKKATIKSGQKILIYGASGAIGTSAVQIAKYLGAEVTGVCSTTNMKLVKFLGADSVLDYTKDDFSLEGRRYDLIFNAVGKSKVHLNCKNLLKKNGKHITVDDSSAKLCIEDLKFLRKLLETGQMKAVIDRSYPLEQIVDAHRYVDKGHKKGNVIIAINHNLYSK
jgi:NADPH:quinone reductase-like Zn-dependent oxidoreductase